MSITRSTTSTIIVYNLGSSLEFTIPFEYLARKFVQLTLLGTSRRPLVLNIDYRFVSSTVVALSMQPGGAFTQLEVRRNTSASERLVDFHDGSILRANDMNLAQLQALHVAEEARDIAQITLGMDDDGNLDARYRRIVRLAKGILPDDAATVGQIEDISSSGGVAAFRELLASSSGSTSIGYGNRTVGDRLADVISVKDYGAKGDGVTDDSASIVQAISAATKSGDSVKWPAGTYLVTSNIVNMHAVKHVGFGKISRGGQLYHIQPIFTQANTLFVGGASGDTSANDGLTPDKAFRNIYEAFNALINAGPHLDGKWTIQLSQGIFDLSAGTAYLKDLTTTFSVSINGTVGTDGIPTTIIDGGGNAGAGQYTHGIAVVGQGLKAYVEHIKAVGFNGSSFGGTRGAFLADEFATVTTKNVHVAESSWFGIYASRQASVRIQGGRLSGCRNGVVTDMAKVSIGYGATDVASGVVIENSTEAGVLWTRESDGHTDFVDFKGNAVGMIIEANSRTDAVGCNFNGNTIGVRTRTGGVFGDNPYTPCVFSNNQTDVDHKAYSGRGSELENSISEHIIAYKRAASKVTGASTADFPVTVIKAGRLKGVGKAVRVTMFGALNKAAAGTQLIVNLGRARIPLTVVGTPENATFKAEAEFHELAGGWRGVGHITHGLNSQRVSGSTGALNVDADVSVSVSVNATDPTTNIVIYGMKAYITG